MMSALLSDPNWWWHWPTFTAAVTYAYYVLQLLGTIADELVAIRKATEARR